MRQLRIHQIAMNSDNSYSRFSYSINDAISRVYQKTAIFKTGITILSIDHPNNRTNRNLLQHMHHPQNKGIGIFCVHVFFVPCRDMYHL